MIKLGSKVTMYGYCKEVELDKYDGTPGVVIAELAITVTRYYRVEFPKDLMEILYPDSTDDFSLLLTVDEIEEVV